MFESVKVRFILSLVLVPKNKKYLSRVNGDLNLLVRGVHRSVNEFIESK